MAVPSTYYTVVGTQFSIPSARTEQTDITAFLINALAALEGHDHSTGRGKPISLVGVTTSLTFSGTALRITGDFSNATAASRVLFQTSTVNGTTNLGVIPNGTSTGSVLNLYNAADPDNAGRVRVILAGVGATIQAQSSGTGSIPTTCAFSSFTSYTFDAATSVAGVLTAASATATPAGGSTSARLLFGTTAGFGIYYGSGAPTVSAAQGSIYVRSDGSSTSTRLYVNTNGTTGWTNFTSAT